MSPRATNTSILPSRRSLERRRIPVPDGTHSHTMAEPQVRIEARAETPADDTPTAGDIEMSGQTDGQGEEDDDGPDIEAPTGEAEAEADEVIAEAITIEDKQSTFTKYV